MFDVVQGGMKATIWNDFVQMLVIGAGIVVLLVLSFIKVGGSMWETCTDGGRIYLNKSVVTSFIKLCLKLMRNILAAARCECRYVQARDPIIGTHNDRVRQSKMKAMSWTHVDSITIIIITQITR